MTDEWHRRHAVHLRAGHLGWRRLVYQRSSMYLGGQVGRLRLEGDLAPFGQLLATAELVQVGKGTTFGLVWVAVE